MGQIFPEVFLLQFRVLEILNILVANICKFLWCMEIELSFSNNCWNVEVLPP